MRKNIAKALSLDISQVSVKATTEEGMGFTGSLDGMSSYAVALLETVSNYRYIDVLAADSAPLGCAGCPGCAVKRTN